MNLLQKKFKSLQDKGKTLREIGYQFSMSSERVRQIINEKYCPRHKIQYQGICKYCTNETMFKKVLSSTPKKGMDEQIKKLSKKGRGAEDSLRRTMLIKKLKDEYKWTFSDIARKLKRHRTTVSHLYYSKG